jgi:hypothetical protein
VLSYRVMLDVPVHLVLFVARLLAAHRREIGTRRGTRALSTWRQAVFALAWFRDRPDATRLGRGSGSPRPPLAGTWTRPSRCSRPARPPCARHLSRRRSRGTAPDPRRQGRSRRPVQGKDHQPERQAGRPVVLRQGPRVRREHPCPVHSRPHPALGLAGPARRCPCPGEKATRRPGARS